MTAPARTRASARRKAPSEREQAPERTRTRANPRVRARSAAAERAYARREERGQRAGGATTESRARKPQQSKPQQSKPQQSKPQQSSPRRSRAKEAEAEPRQSRANKAKQLHTRVTSSRAPFVVAVMVVLAAGIVGTLWLAISAVSNSYELQNAKERVNALSERKETLLEQVSRMSSTPAIQQRARELGMVPGAAPAHLVVHPDGSVTVIGEPKAAKAPPSGPAPGTPPGQEPLPQASPAPAMGQQP